MNMNNSSIDESCINMLNIFRHRDLQTLLGAFGQHRGGRKVLLKDRAIELLRTRPNNINYSAYVSKIYEIYNSLQHEIIVLNNDDSMMHRLSQNQQRQRQRISSVSQIQRSPTQRIYQPVQTPQYPQQSVHISRAALPQVLIKMQRGMMYGNHNISNSIPGNNMVSNNIQNIATGNYQPSRTHTIVSHQLPPNQQMNIKVQDALGLRTTARGNTSYIPSIETVAQIKFQKLPFYEVIDEVIKPTLLTGTDLCTLLNAPKDTKEVTFEHTLSIEHVNYVSTTRDFSHGKKEYHNEYQIRICQLIEPVNNESTDFMPLGLHIRVNMKTCPLPPMPPNTKPNKVDETRRTSRPIDCTAYVKLSPIVSNNITFNWIPDENHYVFAMYVVKKLTSDKLIKKLQSKGGRSSEKTRNYIIKKLADVDPDLATTTSYRISLVCPLGKIRMKMPVKSMHCDHLQCFDAITFILMNEKKPTWTCPICNKPCLYDDIQIENYFLEVVSSPTLKDSNNEIELLADGTWRVYEETKETKNTNNTLDKVIPVDSDSDDEKCLNIKTELSLESSRIQETENNFKSSFCDLTLGGDEEPPTEKYKQENEAQASNAIYVIHLKPQAQVQPQQAVTSSEQGLVIEIDSPSPPSSPILI